MSGNPRYRAASMPATVWGSTLIFTVGLAVAGCSHTEKEEPQQVAAALVATASASPSVMPSNCGVEDSRQTFNDEIFFCTEDEVGALVWLSLDERDEVIAAKAVKKAEAVRAAEEKKAKEAEAEKRAAEEKKVKEAEAEKKAAADKAAEAGAYPNCSAAAAAGAFNIPAGAPGYGPHLDSDNDGIACESSAVRVPVEQPAQPAQTGPYVNCAAARAAGAAPVYRGQPGYGAHLDRDSDGIGCE